MLSKAATPSAEKAKIPQYKKLAAQLREHIRRGDLKPGDRMPSWAQMQRDYGVSITTIERAQKDLAAEGVLVCHQGKGTFVAPRAVPVRKGIIGLSGTGLTHPEESSSYWRQLVHSIRGAAEEAGNHVLLLDDRQVAGWEKVDGLLVTDYSGTLSIRKWTNHMPCVALLAKIPGVCSVYTDDASGIEQAVAYLIGLGHRNIGYLHGPRGRAVDPRLETYGRALRAGGIAPQDAWLREMNGLPQYGSCIYYGLHFIDAGREAMRSWLREDWVGLDCTALLAHNDEAALGAVEALQEAGLGVPEDVSVLGFDGTDTALRARPSLSTIDVPLEEIGRRAVEILLHQIAADATGYSDETGHTDLILPVTLRPGDSTTRLV